MPFQKKVWQFNDIITEGELNRMEQGIEDSLTAIEEHTNNTNNPHGVTPEQIGAETPAGAQAKADAALNSAKQYTDQEVGEVVQDLTSHKNDYVSQMAYAVANGTDTYTVSIPGITSLVEGLSVKVKFQNANTGPSTLNINGLGAKEIRKGNGNVLSADNIKAGQICHLVYNGVNFQLLGEGGEYGTALPEHVLEGYTIGTENGLVEGTMPNNGSQSATLTITGSEKPTKTIPAGYTTGGTITAQVDPSLASVIKNAVTVGGVQGKYKGEFAHGYGTLSKGSTTIYKSGLGFRPTFARIELSRWVEDSSGGYIIYVYGYSYVGRMVMKNYRSDPPSYSLVTVDTYLYSNAFEFSEFPSTIYNYEWNYEWWAYGDS